MVQRPSLNSKNCSIQTPYLFYMVVFCKAYLERKGVTLICLTCPDDQSLKLFRVCLNNQRWTAGGSQKLLRVCLDCWRKCIACRGAFSLRHHIQAKIISHFYQFCLELQRFCFIKTYGLCWKIFIRESTFF